MSDRLDDLQRQRALAQEQLARLERELARESGAVPPPAAVPVVIPPTAGPAQAEAEAEAMLAQYRNDPAVLQGNVKRGCILYFIAALGLLILGLLAFYFLSPRL